MTVGATMKGRLALVAVLAIVCTAAGASLSRQAEAAPPCDRKPDHPKCHPPTPPPPPPPPSPANGDDLPFPIRGIFYYPWYAGNWFDKPGCVLTVAWSCASAHMPAQGYYNQTYSKARWDIDNMQRGAFKLAISSWHGIGHRTDTAIPDLLRAAADDGQGFQVAVYYELDGDVGGAHDPTPTQLASDLAYLRDRYMNHPNYLWKNGRPVVFVYLNGGECGDEMRRWSESGALSSYYVSPQVFSNYRDCQYQPATWHQYGFGPLGTGSGDRQAGYSYTVGPGFWHWSKPAPDTVTDLARFCSTIRAMVSSNEPWQLTISYNEWGEGTQVEPGTHRTLGDYGFAFLDALGRDGQGC